MPKRYFFLLILTVLFLSGPGISHAQTQHKDSLLGASFVDQKLINWMKFNVSDRTKLPLSFYLPRESKKDIYDQMGDPHSVADIIERAIVDEGLVIYDGAVSQIAFSMLGGDENLKIAQYPLKIYWEGRLKDLSNIRAGYPVNRFIYDPERPDAVSSDLREKGMRGFIFRIINAHGRYNLEDPLDGKVRKEGFPNRDRIHWEDWKPIAGDNAWVAMAALHVYHQSSFGHFTRSYFHNFESMEFLLAEELARAALFLQAENGGIRMAPLGTYKNLPPLSHSRYQPNNWWYHQISNENNISWYAAFRMLYEITSEMKYLRAMERIEEYFRGTYDKKEHYFYQGTHFARDEWHPNITPYALDVQTWAIAALGPEKIDEWFGRGEAMRIWREAKRRSGVVDRQGSLSGVGYTEENDRLSVEWTAGAITAAYEIYRHYRSRNPEAAQEALRDAESMRRGIEALRRDIDAVKAAYSYSSDRGWIPFGWYSHYPEVMSLASTGWVVFVDAKFNPFYLPSHPVNRHVADLNVRFASSR